MIKDNAENLATEGNLPRVSIIIVTYNAAKFIQNCLNSIYAQRYPAIDIIVVDGKSTDETVKILQQNNAKISKWVSEKDEGVYDAMNKGLNFVKGDWVYFIGADDELLPDFSQMALELTNPSAIYYANVFAENAKRAGYLNKYRFAKFGAYHQAIIYPKAVFNKYKYDLKYKISADFALTLKLYADKDFHFVYKDYTLANFNHTGISGMQIDEPFQKDKAGMILKYFGLKTWFRYKVYKFKHRHNPRA